MFPGRVFSYAADPFWLANVTLFRFNGSDGSTTITDETGRAWTRFGNAQLDTAQSKFGGSSLLLDGSGDYLTTGDQNSWTMSGDYTIEAWVRLNATGKIHMLTCKRENALDANEWAFLITAGNVLQFIAWTGATILLNLSGSTTLSTGSWYHVAYTKAGSTGRLFLNGALEASGTYSGSVTNTSHTVFLGRDPTTAARDFNGWIDNFRVAIVCRYHAAFNPPAREFPAGYTQ